MADSEVVRPQDVLDGDLRHQLKKAVIAAYMATSVIGDADGHSITSFVNMEEEGDGLRFNYRASILGEDYPVYCTYPSGDWQLNVRALPDIGSYPGFTSIEVNGAWDSLEATVDAWLDPWVLSCPNPNAFQNQITSLARIASQLNIGGSAGDGPRGGDTDLREAVKAIEARANGSGEAMVAFKDAYVLDLWTTIGNQCGMTTAAAVALTAEGQAWSKSYRSLRDLIQVAIGDFYSLADSNGHGENVAAALGATSAVAGLLGASVGVAFPPFGIALGGLSAVIGVYSVMAPAVPAVDTSALKLTGGDYYEMWSSFCEQVKKISTDLSNAERGVSDGCRAVMTDVELNPESYSLTMGAKKERADRGRQYDDFETVLHTELQVSTKHLKEMAGAAELIADQQQTLAGYIGGADAQGNPAAIVDDEWYRGHLPDGSLIGFGFDGYGPLLVFKMLVGTIGSLLETEAKNSHRMAEALMRTALDFSLTDQLSHADLGKLNRQIDDYEAPQDHNPLHRGNDPEDPWYDENDAG